MSNSTGSIFGTIKNGLKQIIINSDTIELSGNTNITNLDVASIANNSVSNTEFQYLSGVTSSIQAQLNNKTTSISSSSTLTIDTSSNATSITTKNSQQVGTVLFYHNGTQLRVQYKTSSSHFQDVLMGSFDLTSPVITILGQNPVSVEGGTTYVDAGATAVDAQDGDLSINTTINVDTSTPGTSYSVTYTASDQAGNTGTAIRSVTVTSTDPSTYVFSGPYQSSYYSPNDLSNHDVFLGTDNNVYGGVTSVLSNDGKTIAMLLGAPRREVRISTLNENNNEWELKSTLSIPSSFLSNSGRLSGDGSTFMLFMFTSIPIYKKNSSNEWVSSGSIDRPSGVSWQWVSNGAYDLSEDGNILVLNPNVSNQDVSTYNAGSTYVYQQDSSEVWNHISTITYHLTVDGRYHPFDSYQIAQNGDLILAKPQWYSGYTMQYGCVIFKRQTGTNNWTLLQDSWTMSSSLGNLNVAIIRISTDGSTVVFGSFNSDRTALIFKYDESSGDYQPYQEIRGKQDISLWPTAYDHILGFSYPERMNNTNDNRFYHVSGNGKILGFVATHGNQLFSLHLLGLGSDGSYNTIYSKAVALHSTKPAGWDSHGSLVSGLYSYRGAINLNLEKIIQISKDGNTFVVTDEWPKTHWPIGKLMVFHGVSQISLATNNVFESYGPYSGPMEFRGIYNFLYNDLYQISFELKIGSGLPSNGASIIYYETAYQMKYTGNYNAYTSPTRDKILHIYINSSGQLVVDELNNNSTIVISNSDVNTYLVNGYYNTITYTRTLGNSKIVLTKFDGTSNTYNNTISGITYLDNDAYSKVLHIANNQPGRDNNLKFSFNNMYIRNIKNSNVELLPILNSSGPYNSSSTLYSSENLPKGTESFTIKFEVNLGTSNTYPTNFWYYGTNGQYRATICSIIENGALHCGHYQNDLIIAKSVIDQYFDNAYHTIVFMRDNTATINSRIFIDNVLLAYGTLTGSTNMTNTTTFEIAYNGSGFQSYILESGMEMKNITVLNNYDRNYRYLVYSNYTTTPLSSPSGMISSPGANLPGLSDEYTIKVSVKFDSRRDWMVITYWGGPDEGRSDNNVVFGFTNQDTLWLRDVGDVTVGGGAGDLNKMYDGEWHILQVAVNNGGSTWAGSGIRTVHFFLDGDLFGYGKTSGSDNMPTDRNLWVGDGFAGGTFGAFDFSAPHNGRIKDFYIYNAPLYPDGGLILNSHFQYANNLA